MFVNTNVYIMSNHNNDWKQIFYEFHLKKKVTKVFQKTYSSYSQSLLK